MANAALKTCAGGPNQPLKLGPRVGSKGTDAVFCRSSSGGASAESTVRLSHVAAATASAQGGRISPWHAVVCHRSADAGACVRRIQSPDAGACVRRIQSPDDVNDNQRRIRSRPLCSAYVGGRSEARGHRQIRTRQHLLEVGFWRQSWRECWPTWFLPGNLPCRCGVMSGQCVSAGRALTWQSGSSSVGNSTTGSAGSSCRCETVAVNRGYVSTCRAASVRPEEKTKRGIQKAAVKRFNHRTMGVLRVRAAAAEGTDVAVELGEDWKDPIRGVIKFESSEIASITGGVLRREGSPGSICTDSRDLQPGDWFVCLRGPNFDGHDFLQMALDRQCSGAIGCHMPPGWTKGFIQVPDTLEALQALGKSVRLRFPGPVVGITGSVGKTTTRVMVGLAISSLGHIHETEGNFNNHVGLPLTLLRMPSTVCACVLELGMNHLGEIKELAGIAIPTIRVITNVGPVHLEGVGSIENVARAKGELFDTANEGDVCIINADDDRVAVLPIPGQGSIRVIRFGRREGCDVRLLDAQPTEGGRGIKCTVESSLAAPKGRAPYRVEFKIGSPGIHLAECACAALAVAGALNVPADVAAEGIAKYQPEGMRLHLEFLEASGITLINDAYNASPITVEGALKFLSSLHTEGRRIALLGDMLELGSEANFFHSEIVRLCQKLELDIVGLVGPHFAAAIQQAALPPLHNFITVGEAGEMAGRIPQLLIRGDAVLVKGSRGIHMECIAEAVKSIAQEATSHLGSEKQ